MLFIAAQKANAVIKSFSLSYQSVIRLPYLKVVAEFVKAEKKVRVEVGDEEEARGAE